MDPTVLLFVGLDYSRHALQLCALDPAGRVLCNRAVPDIVRPGYTRCRRRDFGRCTNLFASRALLFFRRPCRPDRLERDGMGDRSDDNQP